MKIGDCTIPALEIRNPKVLNLRRNLESGHLGLRLWNLEYPMQESCKLGISNLPVTAPTVYSSQSTAPRTLIRPYPSWWE